MLDERDIKLVREANELIVHRGPDAAGEYPGRGNPSGNVMLAMRRLSIVDLKNGWQPLFNEDKSLVLIANGEIYNSGELREELAKNSRHAFSTRSDCEVILHLYEDYGVDCVKHLRGMFAFALWDVKRRRLVIARDRMGEKPLYYCVAGERLYFASELKALLGMKVVPFRLNAGAVHDFLHLGWVPEPATIVEGIRKVPAGSIMTIEVDPWRIEQSEYWSFEAAPAISGDPASLIRAELETIGKLILRADVPIGVALSGGIDSSLIAALAARQSSQQIAAFSVGYPGRPRQDERAQAASLARKLGMPFHEIELSTSEMADFFPELNHWRDEPLADMAGYGYHALSRKAREAGCPVLLQGQGGDELFWGYPWTRRAVEQTLLKDSGRVPGAWSSLRDNLPGGWSSVTLVQAAKLAVGLFQGWKKLRPGLESPENQMVLYDLTDLYQKAERYLSGTYTSAFASRVSDHSPAEMFRVRKPWKHVDIQISKLLCEGYLRNIGLAQGDRLSMANSVEVRLPLADYRLVELVVGLQKTRHCYDRPPKAWLIEAVRDLLPPEVFNRPKRGFNPPMSEWADVIKFRYGSHLVQGALVEHGILDPTMAEKLSSSHSKLSPLNDLFIAYMTLEQWCRSVIARGIELHGYT